MVSRVWRAFTELAFAGLAVSGAAALLLGWLAREVLQGDTARFDAQIRGLVHSHASPALTAVMCFLTELGSRFVLPALVAAALAALWYIGWHRAVVLLAITMAGAILLEVVLKIGFHRLRPIPYFGIPAPESFSFPSGHALSSFAFFATLASLCSGRLQSRRLRILIWVVAVAVITLIGFSRIYLGVHYPTDVIAGYLTAFIWVRVIGHGDRYFQTRRER